MGGDCSEGECIEEINGGVHAAVDSGRVCTGI